MNRKMITLELNARYAQLYANDHITMATFAACCAELAGLTDDVLLEVLRASRVEEGIFCDLELTGGDYHPIREALLGLRGEGPDVRDYIDECEHQDGLQYWHQFDSGEEAEADFLLYIAVQEGTQAQEDMREQNFLFG